MTAKDRSRSPLWVLMATAGAGALVGVGVLTVFGSTGDRTAAGPAPADAITLLATADETLPSDTGGETTSNEPSAPDTTATTSGSAPATAPTSAPATAPTTAPTTGRPSSQAPVGDTTTAAPAQPAEGATISREEAGAIAAAHVDGVVDTINRENDYGAAWDVDVYAPDGEYTIYVSATGEIVRVVGPN